MFTYYNQSLASNKALNDQLEHLQQQQMVTQEQGDFVMNPEDKEPTYRLQQRLHVPFSEQENEQKISESDE
jgi:phage pi2 protein 07